MTASYRDLLRQRHREAITAFETAAEHYLADDREAAEHWRGIGQGRAMLAIAGEVEALVDVVRDHLSPGPCGHTLGTQCPGCDHAAHHGSACLARVIGTSAQEELCRCRFGEETASKAGGPF